MSVDKDAGKGMTDDEFRRMRLNAEVAAIKAPGVTNADIAARLSPDLRSDFWRRELDIFFAKELRA